MLGAFRNSVTLTRAHVNMNKPCKRYVWGIPTMCWHGNNKSPTWLNILQTLLADHTWYPVTVDSFPWLVISLKKFETAKCYTCDMPRKFQYTRKKNWEAIKQKKNKALRVREASVNDPQIELHTTTPTSLQDIHASLLPLGHSWSDQTSDTQPIEQVKLCKISSRPSTSAQPLVVTHSLVVNSDFSWKACVHGHVVRPTSSNPLSSIPEHLNQSSLSKLISILDSCTICPGNPDPHFITMAESRKGKFVTSTGEVRASIEIEFPVSINGETYSTTVRPTDCEVLTHGVKCSVCKYYRQQLRSMYSRFVRKTPTSHNFTNNRYLNTPQRAEKLKSLRVRVATAESNVQKLRIKINHSADSVGVNVDEPLHSDLLSIMGKENDMVKKKFPEGSFRRLFWEEQFKAAQINDPRQMRWHPMMIRWCLNLKLLSSSSYHSLRTSGFIKLPSERTLQDYTHFFQSKSGFQSEVDMMLLQEASIKGLPDWKRHVVLLFDEMKVRESLVFDKHSAQVIGFVHLGELDNQLNAFEQDSSKHPPIATHILCLMVRGVFSRLHFPYAHFSTTGATGAAQFSIIWEAIERLERLGLKVIALTGDGASPNRKVFSLHTSSNEDLCYRVRNPYTQEERYVHFFSDVPHLMKTTRNCWSHSYGHGWTRKLWINGKDISWNHLRTLYDAKMSLATRSEGLFLLKKLSKEHLDLTSFSRMRVDLAAEVLSTSVAEAFSFYGSPETTETQRFVRMFDKFFDCLNVRSINAHVKKRKPNLKPYTSTADERLNWLEKDFLGYLKEWETSVNARKGIKEGQKTLMLLSRETREGLYITVKSFVSATRYLLSLPDMRDHYLLSEHFSQDPVENYFGQLRARGSYCTNPTVQACLTSAQSLRVQGSLAMLPVRGNSSRKKRLFTEEVIDNTPLTKRPRHK